MKRIFAFAILMMWVGVALAARDHASERLLRRVCPDAAGKIVFEVRPGKTDADYFEIGMKGGKPLISGNYSFNIATGLNWYL